MLLSPYLFFIEIFDFKKILKIVLIYWASPIIFAIKKKGLSLYNRRIEVLFLFII
jgi:hypothetical protein